MYSDAEIESAVAAGTLTPEAAAALRAHVTELRSAPGADEEQFRLVTGFNDIFVAIAGILVLVGAGWLGGAIAPWLAGVAVAASAWVMAEYFTRRRRMALPSIIFVLAFVGGLYFGGLALYAALAGSDGSSGTPANAMPFWMAFATTGGSRAFLLAQAASAAIVVAACWIHWRHFAVPITIALGVGAIARLVFTLIAVAAYPNLGQWLLFVVLAGGLAIFGYAMWWDMQDRARLTRRADVAFWLHLAASPLIVHPIFMLIGINLLAMSGSEASGYATIAALLALLVYAALAVVALAVDRRAILVSALVYVLMAAIYLIAQIGVSGAGFAVAIIVIGSSLLMLSAFWQAMRRALLPLLPDAITSRVPLASAVSPPA